MRRATWNRTVPGALLLVLAAIGLLNGSALALVALVVGAVLLLAGLLDKSPEKV